MTEPVEPFSIVVAGVEEPEGYGQKAKSETLSIPKALREACAERDQGVCRVCGRWVGEQGALHHIDFGGDATGMGGRRRHALDNLITVGWVPGHDCHLTVVHARKLLWQPYARLAAVRPGVTMYQLRRWHLAAQRTQRRTESAPDTGGDEFMRRVRGAGA